MVRRKVLIVDDSEVVLMSEQMIFRGGNGKYDVIVARDGDEAVVKATEELPDLILMDVVMPRMNGFDACREIRSQKATQAIPIIMVTTRGEADQVETGYARGCNDYITKPINAVELVEKIKNLIGD